MRKILFTGIVLMVLLVGMVGALTLSTDSTSTEDGYLNFVIPDKDGKPSGQFFRFPKNALNENDKILLEGNTAVISGDRKQVKIEGVTYSKIKDGEFAIEKGGSKELFFANPSNAKNLMVTTPDLKTGMIIGENIQSQQYDLSILQELKPNLNDFTLVENKLTWGPADKKMTLEKEDEHYVIKDSKGDEITRYEGPITLKTSPDGKSWIANGKTQGENPVTIHYVQDKESKAISDVRIGNNQINPTIFSDDENEKAFKDGTVKINDDLSITIGENTYRQNPKNINEFSKAGKDNKGEITYQTKDTEGKTIPITVQNVNNDILSQFNFDDKPNGATLAATPKKLEISTGTGETKKISTIYQSEASSSGKPVVSILNDFKDAKDANSFTKKEYNEEGLEVTKLYKYSDKFYNDNTRQISSFVKINRKTGVMQTHQTTGAKGTDGKATTLEDAQQEQNYRKQTINYNTQEVSIPGKDGTAVTVTIDEKGEYKCSGTAGSDDCKAAIQKFKDQKNYESLGDRWNNVVQSAQAGSALAKYLGFKVKPFEAIQNFLNFNPLGQFLSGNVEDVLFCGKYVKRASSEGILITPFQEYGRILAPIAGHAEGERTAIYSQCTHSDNCTNLFGTDSSCDIQLFTCINKEKKPIGDYLYKVTYALNAQVQEMTVDLILKGEKTVPIYSNLKIEKGSSKSMKGTSAIIQRSRNRFDEICLNIKATKGGNFCTPIVDTDSKPILRQEAAQGTYTSSGGSATEYNSNWD